MSEAAQVKFGEESADDRALRAMEFKAAVSMCEERNEFVGEYLALLDAKLRNAKSVYEGLAPCPSVLLGRQCAAFLAACGQREVPIPDGVQMLREFVDFLDVALVHWR